MSESGSPLVQVMTTTDGALLALVKSLLDSAGIPFVVQGEEALGLFPMGPFGNTGPIQRVMGARIYVAEEQAEEARTLIDTTAEFTDETSVDDADGDHDS